MTKSNEDLTKVLKEQDWGEERRIVDTELKRSCSYKLHLTKSWWKKYNGVPANTRSTSKFRRKSTTASRENCRKAIHSRRERVIGHLVKCAFEGQTLIAELVVVSTRWNAKNADVDTVDKPETVSEKDSTNISAIGKVKKRVVPYIDTQNCFITETNFLYP